MYRTAVTIRKISPNRTNRTLTRSKISPVGNYFPDRDRRSIHYPAYYMVTCQHDRKLDTVCLFTIYLLPLKVFFSREISFAKLTPFLFSFFAAFLSFSFLDLWRQLSLLPRVEITVFSKNIKVNVKLIHTSVLGVRFFWDEVDYRSADVAWRLKTLGWKVIGLLRFLSEVLRNTWIRVKKASFLDDGQICLAVVNYREIIDRWMLGRLIQVNEAFYSIKRSRVINRDRPVAEIKCSVKQWKSIKL